MLVLLLCISIPTTIVLILAAPWLSILLFDSSSFTYPARLAVLVVLVQNLTLPGFAWLRAEDRPILFSILSALNLLVSLGATLVLVGVVHLGIAGSLIATGGGYAAVAVCTLPVVLLRVGLGRGLHVRRDITWNLLSFGFPLVANFASVWVLQLSDRYLLSRLGSLTETASYAVAYSLGGVMRDAIALLEAGFAVTIVDVEKERTRPVEEDIRGVHFKHIFMPSWFVPARFKLWYLVKLVQLLLVSTIRLLQTPADIYHAHVERTFPACYIAARLRRKPFILDAPELTLSDPRYASWHRLNAASARLIAGMLARCAGAITASPLYAQEMCNRYHIPEVTVIRNVPAYRSTVKTDRLRHHLGLRPDVRIALYQGNLQPNRGLQILVRAAPFLERDTIIVMMGRGFGDTPSELNMLIAHEGVADRVKILPPVPYEELLDWTSSADIGLSVLPPDYSLSIQKCLPNKLFEYLMAGLPVLASQLDAIVEVLKTYDVGQVVASLTPAGVGTAINALLADRERLDHMRHNALEAARSVFCWEKESQTLIRLYQEILSKHSVKSRVPASSEVSEQSGELLPAAQEGLVS
jgi:glycosyltransferase involved in cell wall biosynthesis